MLSSKYLRSSRQSTDNDWQRIFALASIAEQSTAPYNGSLNSSPNYMQSATVGSEPRPLVHNWRNPRPGRAVL
jgi:hypothetical protein